MIFFVAENGEVHPIAEEEAETDRGGWSDETEQDKMNDFIRRGLLVVAFVLLAHVIYSCSECMSISLDTLRENHSIG